MRRRLELTPSSEDKHGEEGSSSTSVEESASSGEVTAAQNNREQTHMHHTRSRPSSSLVKRS